MRTSRRKERAGELNAWRKQKGLPASSTPVRTYTPVNDGLVPSRKKAWRARIRDAAYAALQANDA